LAGARDRRPIPRVSPRLGETEADTNIERQAYEGGDLWINPMKRDSASNEDVALGSHERRPLQQAAARRLPLCPVSDRGRVAMQYVAKGQHATSNEGKHRLSQLT
jgi:hypothetical protein